MTDITDLKPELWPDEFWRVLATLYERTLSGTATPRIALSERICPDYAHPFGPDHEWFEEALHSIEGQWIDIGWNANHARAEWVRLRAGKGSAVQEILSTYRPFLLPTGQTQAKPQLDQNCIRKAIERYGPLGLRTAAHLAFGNSHALDGIDVPDIPGLWIQPDARVAGASLVRVGGQFALRSPTRQWETTWERPGHFLWEWEVTASIPDTLKIGQRLLLIENPYPMWELLSRLKNEDVTLVCLHGETLRSADLSEGNAIRAFLSLVFHRFPSISTEIWCDPDPAGLFIAANASQLVKNLGGKPSFLKMDHRTFDEIEQLSLAERKLRALTPEDQSLLNRFSLPIPLQILAQQMRSKGIKGEQEGLVVSMK